MEKVDKVCSMSRKGMSGWMFLLVLAHPGSSGPRAVKWSSVFQKNNNCTSNSCLHFGDNWPQIWVKWISTYSRVHIITHSHTLYIKGKKKEKKDYLYSTFKLQIISKRSGVEHIVLRANTPCLPFLRSFHQRSPLSTEVTDIQLQLTTHLSTRKGWKAEFA